MKKDKTCNKNYTGRNLDDFFMIANELPRQPERWEFQMGKEKRHKSENNGEASRSDKHLQLDNTKN